MTPSDPRPGPGYPLGPMTAAALTAVGWGSTDLPLGEYVGALLSAACVVLAEDMIARGVPVEDAGRVGKVWGRTIENVIRIIHPPLSEARERAGRTR